MHKKKILLISILVFLLIVAVIVFFQLRKSPDISLDTRRAIPSNVAVIIEVADFNRFIKTIREDNIIWNGSKAIPWISSLEGQISYLDSIIQSNSHLSTMFRNNRFTISIHPASKESMEYLFIISLRGSVDEKGMSEIIGNEVIGKASMTSRRYENTHVYDVLFESGPGLRNFSYCITGNVFMLSFSSILLEEAIRHLQFAEHSITESVGFEEVAVTAGKNVSANIFINYKSFPRLLSYFIDNAYKSNIRDFTNFANWSELDLNIKKDMILMNGFTYPGYSSDNYLNLFVKQEPQIITSPSIIPTNTPSFVALGIQDNERFFSGYQEFLDKSGKLKQRKNKLAELTKLFGTNIEQLFISQLAQEIGIFFTDEKNLDLSDNTFYYFKMQSRSSAENEMKKLLEYYARQNNVSSSSLIQSYRIDRETSFNIYSFPAPNLPRTLFGNLFGSIEGRYFTFIDNFLVFGNSYNQLAKVLHNHVLRRTLVNDISYNRFSEHLTLKSNFYFYCNAGNSPGFILNYLDPKQKKAYEANISSIRKFQRIALQFNSTNGMVYNNFFIKYSTEVTDASHSVWETLLDTIADFKPQFVIHHNTGESEIFVQDLNNNIYLINNAGRILWKIRLNEPILGEVYQIDYYKNNRLQFLFNTRDRLHLIDRNGNYVARYPITLRSPATNGLALFDYEKDKNYRIFIAGEDRKIYAFDREGNIVTGWGFGTTESEVTHPVNHFRVGDRDYIVFADKYRLYMLDRQGNTRVEVSERFPVSQNAGFILDANPPSARLAITDTAGTVHFITFDGKIQKVKMGDFTANHYFDFQDINADGDRNFIFVDGNKLEVYNKNKSILFSSELSHEITNRPVYYHFSFNDRKIGVVSAYENRIYLYNGDGTLYDGFPLKGRTLFSIGVFDRSSSKFNLIVGGNDNFLYNYSVQ